MARVIFADVGKRYGGGREAIAGLSLEIADGEFVVLVGPSGSGKSTALRMIAGLEEISSGEVWIGERVVNDLAPGDRDVAMVFQNYALYPHMTVGENMGFALRLAKMSAAEIELKVREAAAALELDELLDRKPAELSGGQRQRVAMGRAIVREPQAFLMDEPLSNLDAKLRVQTREEIAELQQRLGVTTVYVTHDQTEALTLGDRIAVLRDGRLQQFGAPDELYLRPANLFVAGFIGSPAMNLVAATVSDGAIRLPFAPAGARRATVRRGRSTRRRARGHRRAAPGSPRAGQCRQQRSRPALRRARRHRRVDRRRPVRPRPHRRTAGRLQPPRRARDQAGAAPSRARDGAPRLVARLDPSTGARPGTRITLRADPARVYVFDAASGSALTGANATPTNA